MSTAVILTARKERDSKLPYPLIPFVDHIALIDRTLQILRELRFTKILIVVGYRAELFRKYQADDVIFIENPDYPFTSSMASLAMVDKYIDEDFLLVEGDTFFEKKLLEKLSSTNQGNCLTMTEESGSGDECFVETQSGFVTQITKDKHRVKRFEGEMIGALRISLQTFRKMIDAWLQAENRNLNYEYVLMDVTEPLDRPCLKFKNLIWGDVDNQDNFLKLRNYIYPRLRRKEDPFDYENLIAYLRQIFPNEDVEQAQIDQLGGLSNKNFKVTLNDNQYVLRVPGIGSEGMVVREYEEQNSIQGSKMGINAPVLYFNKDTGIKLAEYIRNAETLNPATIQRKSHLRQIALLYKKLHQSNIRFNNDFNVFHEIQKYEQLMCLVHAEMYDGYNEIRDYVLSLEDRLNELGIQLKPCHNDAVPENFIKDDEGRIYLIDWEYSGMNDPFWDFAALFLESDFDEVCKEYFLDCYFENNIPVEAYEKILIYQILQDILWAIWTVVKEAQGDDFESYGLDRFKRGLRLILIFIYCLCHMKKH